MVAEATTPVDVFMGDTAVIAIGRNEGERLRQCLASALASGCRVVYVDSKSTDGSVELARTLGAQVVELDMSLPFSAARARNAGFAQLGNDIEFVQFVDGDCEIVAGWIDRAMRELQARTDVAAVCGRRRERFPEKSIYNRLADIEWDTPIGEVQSCGGDAMIRASVFREVGGFDVSVVAGEEPEMCQRMRGKGWKILRIDAEMTLHDAAMMHVGQWWRRCVRGGYGAMDVATRFGSEGLFSQHVWRTRIWAVGWPLAVIVGGGMLGGVFGTIWGGIAAFLLAMALPLQMARTALRIRKRTRSVGDAIAYGLLTMLGKWPDWVGQLSYRRDRRAGRLARMIEYKQESGRMVRAV
jgi:cellulose synthase/poly-beta-1,6-N-acetylglucosamine synthase-like glycosyltransferase